MRLIYLLILLSACVSFPKTDQACLMDQDISLSVTEQRALQSGYFQTGEWPSEEWWEMFSDPQLSGLVRLALQESPSLKKAEARLSEAQEMAKRERASLFPEIDGNASTNWERYSKHGLERGLFPAFPAELNLIDVSLNFSYEFDFWGKNRNLYRAALGEARAESAEVAQARLVLSVAVAHSYFSLQAYKAELEEMRRLLHQREELFALKKLQKEKALISDIEVLKAERQLFAVMQTFLTLEKQEKLEEHRLKMLVGRGPDALLEVERSVTLFEKPVMLPLDISVGLLARRPDLMAQIGHVEAQAHQVGAAQAAFYPNINLMALVGLESLHLHNLFTYASRQLSLTPAINLPLFTAGRIKANWKAREASFRGAVESYHEMLLKAVQEVADQITTAQTINRQLEVKDKTVQSALASYSLSSARYDSGVANYQEVLDAEGLLLEERLSWLDLHYGRLNALVSLMRSLGGGYHAS